MKYLLIICLLFSLQSFSQQAITNLVTTNTPDIIWTRSVANAGKTLTIKAWLSSTVKADLKRKSDSIKILYAKDVTNKAEIALLKSTIAIMKTDIVALKKSDTLFFMGLPGAGTRLSPFNMTTILDDIELLKTKIPDYAFEKTITTTETKLSNRINALSKRIYRLEKKLIKK